MAANELRPVTRGGVSDLLSKWIEVYILRGDTPTRVYHTLTRKSYLIGRTEYQDLPPDGEYVYLDRHTWTTDEAMTYVLISKQPLYHVTQTGEHVTLYFDDDLRCSYLGTEYTKPIPKEAIWTKFPTT